MIHGEVTDGDFVLLIEADLMLLATTHSVLQKQGYTVVSCSTPEEALAFCGENPHARVVVTNVLFPVSELTGLQVADGLKRICGASAVFTGRHDAALLNSLGGFPNHYFLAQPFTAQQLVATLAEAWWSGRRSGGEQAETAGEEQGTETEGGAGATRPSDAGCARFTVSI